MAEAGPYTEYLHDAHQLAAEALANGGPVGDELDAASAVLDALLDAGWALIHRDDLATRFTPEAWAALAKHFGDPFPAPG